jgi:hypothetical protein
LQYREGHEVFSVVTILDPSRLCAIQTNEAPRSKLRGIKSEFAEANPPSLFKLRRVRPAIHPCSKLQGILAKANKMLWLVNTLGGAQ